MAEGLAVVSAVSSIAQLAQLGGKVLGRLREFHMRSDDVPNSLQQISTQLPLLLNTAQSTQDAINAGVIKVDTEKALLPAINDCKVQFKSLEVILNNL